MNDQKRKTILTNLAFLLAVLILFTAALGIWLFVVGQETRQTAAARTQLAQATLPAPLITTATQTPRPPTATLPPTSTPSVTPSPTATPSLTPSHTPTPQTFTYPSNLVLNIDTLNPLLNAISAADITQLQNLVRPLGQTPCVDPEVANEGPVPATACGADEEPGDLVLGFYISGCHGSQGSATAVADLFTDTQAPFSGIYAIYTVNEQSQNFLFLGQPEYVIIIATEKTQYAKALYIREGFISSYHLGCGQTAAELAQTHINQGSTPILPPLTQPYDPTN